MTNTFYKKHSGKWFESQTGIALKDIFNNGGACIKKGAKVRFSGKSGRGGLNITTIEQDPRVSISQVEPEHIDLIDQP